MSGTMSSASNDWLQFYQPANLSDQPPPPQTAEIRWNDRTHNVTTTNSPQLSRVNRSNARRRSRASRRTPTTLVNTDTTNFRAMVQQFTGGGQTLPSFNPCNGSNNQYLPSYNNNNSSHLSFGQTSSVVAAADGYNLQFRQPLTGGDGGGGQQYYQNEQHQAFLQTLQNYTAAGPTGEGVGRTSIDAGEDNNSYGF